MYSEIVKGVEDVVNKKGYIIFLCDFSNDPQMEKMYFDQLSKRRIDGLIAVSTRAEQETFKAITDSQIPVVLVGGSAHQLDFKYTIRLSFRDHLRKRRCSREKTCCVFR